MPLPATMPANATAKEVADYNLGLAKANGTYNLAMLAAAAKVERDKALQAAQVAQMDRLLFWGALCLAAATAYLIVKVALSAYPATAAFGQEMPIVGMYGLAGLGGILLAASQLLPDPRFNTELLVMIPTVGALVLIRAFFHNHNLTALPAGSQVVPVSSPSPLSPSPLLPSGASSPLNPSLPLSGQGLLKSLVHSL